MEQIRKLLEFILTSLVDSPDKLIITVKEDDEKIIFFVRTRPGEEGQLIGGRGSLSSAIRLILKSSTKKFKISKHVYLDILDSTKTPF